MYNYSLFDSFFAPTRVIVVSEERLIAKERELKQQQLEVIDNRIDELARYRLEVEAQLKRLGPAEPSEVPNLEAAKNEAVNDV